MDQKVCSYYVKHLMTQIAMSRTPYFRTESAYIYKNHIIHVSNIRVTEMFSQVLVFKCCTLGLGKAELNV